MPRRLGVATVLGIAVICLVITSGRVEADDPAHRVEVELFQKVRDASLRAEDGWLSVSGLFWLKPGRSVIGSAASNEVVLREGVPPQVGVLTLATDSPERTPGPARFQPAPGVKVLLNGAPFSGGTIRTDADGGQADVLAVGDIRLILLRRNDRFALRVKDNQAPTRTKFAGLRWFPIADDWRVVAQFTPHLLPKTISFDTIVGGVDVMPCPGTVTFERGGKSYRLEAAAEPDGKLWFVFRDATAGKTTAANARQLTTDAPENGLVVLDFNKAINLPCAYIEHATCPIAPPQNRLPIEVTAGEQTPRTPLQARANEAK